jgi:hypothetical protein
LADLDAPGSQRKDVLNGDPTNDAIPATIAFQGNGSYSLPTKEDDGYSTCSKMDVASTASECRILRTKVALPVTLACQGNGDVSFSAKEDDDCSKCSKTDLAGLATPMQAPVFILDGDDKPSKIKSMFSQKPPPNFFPQKLLNLLNSNDKSATEILYWLPGGDSICVFLECLRMTHFNGIKLTSLKNNFHRWYVIFQYLLEIMVLRTSLTIVSMNLRGFDRIEDKAVPAGAIGYRNKYFLKGRPELIRHMRLNVNPKISSRHEAFRANSKVSISNRTSSQQSESSAALASPGARSLADLDAPDSQRKDVLNSDPTNDAIPATIAFQGNGSYSLPTKEDDGYSTCSNMDVASTASDCRIRRPNDESSKVDIPRRSKTTRPWMFSQKMLDLLNSDAKSVTEAMQWLPGGDAFCIFPDKWQHVMMEELGLQFETFRQALLDG